MQYFKCEHSCIITYLHTPSPCNKSQHLIYFPNYLFSCMPVFCFLDKYTKVSLNTSIQSFYTIWIIYFYLPIKVPSPFFTILYKPVFACQLTCFHPMQSLCIFPVEVGFLKSESLTLLPSS